jgi:alanine racemase
LLNWVEISADALRNNVGEFRRRLGDGVKLGAVVKSNAYGHGMLETARVVRDAGADWLCVNSIHEAVALREAGHDLPVLVMGYVPREALDEIVARDLRLVVYNADTLDRLEELAERQDRRVQVHLKVETGTYRQGVTEEGLPVFLEKIRGSKRLELEGVTTHYANIEDTTDHSFAERQIATFERLAEMAAPVPLRHTACSAAAILFTRTHMDLARIGISLYGLWPSRETYVSCLETGKPTLELHPVMIWKSRIVQVKHVPEGSYVGYGCTFRTTRPSLIAVLPVGYHEGYDRGLSGVAHVLVRGRRAPVRGRVCMNMTMVDVTDVPDVALEDEVVLLGAQESERVSAEQLATWCGTISYEIVSRIHPSLPRIVT